MSDRSSRGRRPGRPRGGGRSPGSKSDSPAPSTSKGKASPATKVSTNAITEAEFMNMPVVDTPEVGVEEVVLNRRGMPARQRKRNRFYYDDEQMITSDSQLRMTKQMNKSPPAISKKIKQEPVEEEEITIQEEPVGFQYGGHRIIYETDPSAVNLDEYEDYEEVTNEVIVPDRRRQDALLMPPPPTPRSKPKVKFADVAEQSTFLGPPTPAQVAQAVSAIVNKPRSKGASSAGPSTVDFDYTKVKIKTEKESPPKKKKGSPEKKATKPLKSILKKSSNVLPPPGPDNLIVDFSSVFEKPLSKPLKSILKRRPSSGDHNAESQLEGGYNHEMDLVKQEPPDTTYWHEPKGKKAAKHPKEPRQAHAKQPRDPTRTKPRRPSTSHYGGQLVSLANIGGAQTAEDIAQALRTGIDKKTAHSISLRLRNLLKLPKAHKWVCYEWFYSNIDKVLFDGDNDFQTCLKESFPNLRCSKLAHAEWTKIRRMMGKPRRCSQAFFDEEREELQRRRHKIRMIQQRKITDFNYKELPDEIPLQLVIGTKVTGRLRKPQDGLFTGTIEAVDTSNNTYRITFDRVGLGTHSIPDYEVLSNDPPETVSTSSFALKIPRRSYGGVAGTQFKISSALADEMAGFPKSPFPADGMLGGFPIRLLDMIVRLSKLLKAKREKILHIKELNVEAEKLTSYGRTLNEDYRIRYSRCVLDLDSMNKEMSLYLEAIQQYCLDIAPDHGANQMIVPEIVQEHCRQEAALIVDSYNAKSNRNLVYGRRPLTLIANLTSLALQVKALSSGERNLYEVKSIKDTLKEIKASLDGKNVQFFQDHIEIPMNRIQAGMTLNYR